MKRVQADWRQLAKKTKQPILTYLSSILITDFCINMKSLLSILFVSFVSGVKLFVGAEILNKEFDDCF